MFLFDHFIFFLLLHISPKVVDVVYIFIAKWNMYRLIITLAGKQKVES